jgi:hypothetical protein
MKTAVLLAASAMLCIGVGVAYADGGDDEGGTVANTFFTELPGVVPTAPGAILNDVAVNGYQTKMHAVSTWTAPGATVQR